MSFVDTELTLRFGAFISVFLVMALWEMGAPMRHLTTAKAPRWLSNMGLVVINTLTIRIILPVTAVGAAVIAESHGWGFFHMVPCPSWMMGLITVVLLDLVVYMHHVVFHRVPALWRLHMVHHADVDFDVTTGLRFHTLEILISMGLKIIVVIALGPAAWAVTLFEILLNATAMFNHSNIRLPGHVDRVLRLFVVTPHMHRVHHSIDPAEFNTNFGFNLPWWDRLFRTYRAQPEQGHEHMSIGLAHLRNKRVVRLPWMLALPFMRREEVP